MEKNPGSATADAVAKKLEQEKQLHEALAKNCRQLYKLRCFETMTHQNGMPIAMRVPGGWIFYIVSGGGDMNLITGEDGEDQTIVGKTGPTINQVFVPYSIEFINGPDPISVGKTVVDTSPPGRDFQ